METRRVVRGKNSSWEILAFQLALAFRGEVLSSSAKNSRAILPSPYRRRRNRDVSSTKIGDYLEIQDG